MTETEQKMLEIEEKRKDRRQKERSDRRAAEGKFLGDSMKTIGSIVGKMNDPSWYKNLPNLSKVSTSLTDFNPIGGRDPAYRDRVEAGAEEYRIPGIPSVVRVNYAPTIGNTQHKHIGPVTINVANGLDPMNTAINRIATTLESRLARVAQYTRDTIGRYLFIVTDVACNILRIKSAIDVFDYANATKPFVARQMIRALGFNYADFRDNISAYRLEWISLVESFNKGLPIPSDLSFLKRQLFLSTSFVKDGSHNDYCTYLVFNRAVHYMFPNKLVMSEAQYPSAWIDSHSDCYIAMQLPSTGYVYSSSGLGTSLITELKRTVNLLVNGATWKPLIRDLRGGTKANTWLTIPSDVSSKTFKCVSIDEVRQQVHNLDTYPLFIYENAEHHGLVVSSFSIGGTTADSVDQGSAYGEPYLGIGLPSGNIPAGFMLHGHVASADLTKYAKAMGLFWPGSDWLGRYAFSRPLISDNNDMTGDEILVSTRFKTNFATWTASVTGSEANPLKLHLENDYESLTGTKMLSGVIPTQYGTELVLSVQIIFDAEDSVNISANTYMTAAGCYYGDGGLMDTDVVYISTEINALDTITPFSSSVFDILGLVSTFDWFPPIKIQLAGKDEDDIPYIDSRNYVGEVDHYTWLPSDVMGKLHAQCIESEFTLVDAVYLEPIK